MMPFRELRKGFVQKDGSRKELRTYGLVKRYGKRRVVDEVSINVYQGEVVGLLGPNGAGKSTTFYCIVGFVEPDEGAVFLDGENIVGYPVYERARRGITYLPQETSVFRGLTAAENIVAILEMFIEDREVCEEKTKNLLMEFGLDKVADVKAERLSGGERRKVEICRALATEPDFILLDEPFVGIDPLTIKDIQETIISLKNRGIGVLISDHNVSATLSICDEAYIIHNGRVLEKGAPEEIISNERARRLYLGESFRL
ncbi:MAG: LPS export ABC transporter ATP-binding protein [Syntrophobacterales bacterium]|nr:LPS export ABC transporter ATP-binding protein [Syntrophobacterales bacterium]